MITQKLSLRLSWVFFRLLNLDSCVKHQNAHDAAYEKGKEHRVIADELQQFTRAEFFLFDEQLEVAAALLAVNAFVLNNRCRHAVSMHWFFAATRLNELRRDSHCLKVVNVVFEVCFHVLEKFRH